MGTSTRPVLFTLPTREKILVPLLFSVPMLLNHSAPFSMISGTVAQVSTLFRLVGLAPDAAYRGAHVLGPRLAHVPLDGGHQGARLAAHEGAGSPVDGDVEGEARARGRSGRAARSLAPAARATVEVLHGDGVFLAHVDEALVGADGVGADDQAFQDAVGVALEQAPVHVGAGVALVGVDDDVLDVARRVPGGLPLDPGREAAAAATAQFGGLDLVQHLLGRHLEERLGQGGVAAMDDVGIDVVGIDEAVQAEHQRESGARRRGSRPHGGSLAPRRRGRPAGSTTSPPTSVVWTISGGVLRLDLEVGDLLGQDGDYGASLAESVAARPEYLHLARPFRPSSSTKASYTLSLREA